MRRSLASRAQRAVGLMPVYLLVVPVVLLMLLPYVIMVRTALTPHDQLYVYPLRVLPTWWRLANFVDTWIISRFDASLRNSLVVSVGSTVLALLVAIPGAYALARFRFRFRRAFLYLILVTQMFSPILIIVGLFKTISTLGVINTYWALIITYAAFGLAFTIWMLTGFFRSIPQELEEAAWIDGCTRMGALRQVIAPLALPGIVTAMIFLFISAWNEFLIAVTFIFDDRLKTLPPLVVGLSGTRYQTEWEQVMAASLMATLPVVILFVFLERHLVRSLTAGAVK